MSRDAGAGGTSTGAGGTGTGRRAGYKFMADQWYTGIGSLLPK